MLHPGHPRSSCTPFSLNQGENHVALLLFINHFPAFVYSTTFQLYVQNMKAWIIFWRNVWLVLYDDVWGRRIQTQKTSCDKWWMPICCLLYTSAQKCGAPRSESLYNEYLREQKRTWSLNGTVLSRTHFLTFYSKKTISVRTLLLLGLIITACKCFLHPASKNLSILAFGIFPHSSWQNTSCSEIFFGLLACMACLRFSIIFKHRDWWCHTKTLIHLFWRYLVDFEVCFGSLSCRNIQPLINFNVWTDLQNF